MRQIQKKYKINQRRERNTQNERERKSVNSCIPASTHTHTHTHTHTQNTPPHPHPHQTPFPPLQSVQNIDNPQPHLTITYANTRVIPSNIVLSSSLTSIDLRVGITPHNPHNTLPTPRLTRVMSAHKASIL